MKEKKQKKEKIKVSDEFIDIYRNFFICNQVDSMKLLSKLELYFLLVLAIDKYDENFHIVLDNLRPFKEEIEKIFLVHDSKEVNDVDLIQAGELTGGKYVDIYRLVDKNGDALPPIYTEAEAILLRREKTISNIIDKI